MGGKSGGGAEFPEGLVDISNRLAQLSEQTFEISRPGLEAGRDVLTDVLRTGGSQALTPAIQQAVQGTRAATSQGLRATEEDLTRRGITGGAAARILAQQRLGGDIAAAQIGPNFALPLIAGAAAQSIGQISPALSGLGGAGSLLTPGITKGQGKSGGGLGPILGAGAQGLGIGFGSRF